MPELNFDKVYASLNLRIKGITNIDEFDELTKEFLGKNSLIAEERKKLSSLSSDDKKNYGRKLTEATEFITSEIKAQRQLFLNSQFTSREEVENTDISIDWTPSRGLTNMYCQQLWMKLFLFFLQLVMKLHTVQKQKLHGIILTL